MCLHSLLYGIHGTGDGGGGLGKKLLGIAQGPRFNSKQKRGSGTGRKERNRKEWGEENAEFEVNLTEDMFYWTFFKSEGGW